MTFTYSPQPAFTASAKAQEIARIYVCGNNTKTADEEHVSSENVPTFCWSMVMIK